MGDEAEQIQEDTIGTGNDARLAILKGIADTADEFRSDEFEGGAVDADGAQDNQVVESQDSDAAVMHAATEQANPIIKVLGQDVEVTPDLLARAGKIAAADTYLAEAKRLRESLTAQAQQTVAAPQAKKEINLQSIAQAIQMGTEEEAVAALDQLMRRTLSVQDELPRQIDERLAFTQAVQTFQNEFPDIVGDQRLMRLANEEDDRLRKSGDARPYIERFRAIGQGLQEWRGAVQGVSNGTKQERKAVAPNMPKAAAAKFAEERQEEHEPSISDTITAMAQARGGPQWMQGAQKN